ncbi:MAG: trigger factor [candidate division Zixibacteria bacterium]
MLVEVIDKEGLKRELNIKIPAEEVDKAYQKVYADMGKKVKLDGFRPGKVPKDVIRKRFHREATAEVIDSLINKHYSEAICEKNLEPVGTPVLTNVDIDEGKPLQLSFGIEVMPKLDEIKIDGLKAEEIKAEVTDSEIDEVVEITRKQQATLRTVDRPANETDMLICDLEPIDGAIEGLGDTPMNNQEIDLDSPKTVKEFKEALPGAKRDDVKDVVLSFPEDHVDKKFAGKSVTFKTTVKEVKVRILPELNDDFAKRLGLEETFLEFKINLRKRMEAERKTELLRIQKRDIIDQIVEKNEFDVPEAMLESYFKNIIKDMKQQNQEVDEKEIREKYRPIGINSAKWYLLYHRLAVLEKIEVSAEDTENWIKRFAESYRMEFDKAKEILTQTGKAAEIKDGILEDKVIEFLLSKTDTDQKSKETKEG